MITVMAGTQVLKTELLINVACYYVHQDPSAILFVQPSQGAAESFSKERFAPTVDVSPELRELIARPRAKDSENTITHKDAPGASLDFVGANSPTDLASRPKRIILCDEINKFPPSAGAEGDPLKLAEERASTYAAVGRAKFVRTCSPTVEGECRISREYAASDMRRCFVTCPHCSHEQVLTWAHVRWEKRLADGSIVHDLPEGEHAREHFPETAGVACIECGVVWTESERIGALKALASAPDHGWRQTRSFSCCDHDQTPEQWDDAGRALCLYCSRRASYGGHAGFHVSKLYSARHSLRGIVREFLEAKGDPESLKKWVNTALAEVWAGHSGETVDATGLAQRAEPYGPEDLPDAVRVITGFCDVQGDRLEVQLIGWGAAEEAWPFLYEVIHSDPAQPHAWHELDALLARTFRTSAGRALRVAAFGIDTGGHHGAQVYAYVRRRRGRRIFSCKGVAGRRPIWPLAATRAQSNDKLWLIGVDTAKDAIYGKLKIAAGEPGQSWPGYVHFPEDDAFGPQYFAQLTSERRETRKRMGQPVTVWVLPEGKRNEVLDTFVGALAVRKSLPRIIEAVLQYAPAPLEAEATDERTPPPPPQAPRPVRYLTPNRPGGFLNTRRGWLERR